MTPLCPDCGLNPAGGGPARRCRSCRVRRAFFGVGVTREQLMPPAPPAPPPSPCACGKPAEVKGHCRPCYRHAEYVRARDRKRALFAEAAAVAPPVQERLFADLPVLREGARVWSNGLRAQLAVKQINNAFVELVGAEMSFDCPLDLAVSHVAAGRWRVL